MASADSFIASIEPWAGYYAPENWAFCQGQTLTISDYAPLYSIIGTTYGGDRYTNFMLPDMRGLVPIGAGYRSGGSNYLLAEKGGNSQIVLASHQMPVHTHSAEFYHSDSLFGSVELPVMTGFGVGNNDPNGKYFGSSGAAKLYYTTPTANSTLAEVPVDFSGYREGGDIEIESTGSTLPFSILQPYTVVNFIICLKGTYPPRPAS